MGKGQLDGPVYLGSFSCSSSPTARIQHSNSSDNNRAETNHSGGIFWKKQMSSLVVPGPLSPHLRQRRLPSSAPSSHRLLPLSPPAHRRVRSRRSFSTAAHGTALMASSTPPKGGVYTVGDFMTTKDKLRVVKPSTSVDEALEILVENRITGFPVIDDDRKLVGLVSDYDLLALDSVSGSARTETSMFPDVDSTWKVFNELQNLLTKTNGKLVADVMTPAPVVVRETTNLEDAARLLLETRYRRLPVVDAGGELVGIITRGDVVRAALQIKRTLENTSQ